MQTLWFRDLELLKLQGHSVSKSCCKWAVCSYAAGLTWVLSQWGLSALFFKLTLFKGANWGGGQWYLSLLLLSGFCQEPSDYLRLALSQFFFFFFFFLPVQGFQGLMFARQVLYHLSHSTSPHFSLYGGLWWQTLKQTLWLGVPEHSGLWILEFLRWPSPQTCLPARSFGNLIFLPGKTGRFVLEMFPSTVRCGCQYYAKYKLKL
jgi:hypothetical protein